MTPLFTVAFATIAVLFAGAALLSVYRIVQGPSILDRMIASDVLLTTLILVVGAEMVYNGHTRTIPVMLVMSATAAFATIAVARYVSRQDLMTKNGSDELDVEMNEPKSNGPKSNGPKSNGPAGHGRSGSRASNAAHSPPPAAEADR